MSDEVQATRYFRIKQHVDSGWFYWGTVPIFDDYAGPAYFVPEIHQAVVFNTTKHWHLIDECAQHELMNAEFCSGLGFG